MKEDFLRTNVNATLALLVIVVFVWGITWPIMKIGIDYIPPVFFGALRMFVVSLRRRPSDLGFDPMVSPTLCPTLSTALKSKFFPLPMVIAAGIGQMMTNCALWRKALSATDKRQQQRVGMAFAGRC